MSDLHATVKAYLDTWGQSEAEQRQALLARCWAPGGTYTDPLAHATGRDALVTLTGICQQLFPGASLSLKGDIMHHGQVAHFYWDMCAADGSLMLEGKDFCQLGDDGMMQRIVAFFSPQGLEVYGEQATAAGCGV